MENLENVQINSVEGVLASLLETPEMQDIFSMLKQEGAEGENFSAQVEVSTPLN